jgi:hypothetical protein
MDMNQEIIDLKARIAELESLIAPVTKLKPKWSPVGGDWWIDGEGHVNKSDSCRIAKEFGMERPTEQQAEHAQVEMRKFNRLLALRDELCSDDVITKNTTAQKHIVYFNAVDMQWWVTYYHINFITPVFSTESSAQRACNMLNSGEVIL